VIGTRYDHRDKCAVTARGELLAVVEAFDGETPLI
jgi:hypothetical protein